MVNTRSEAGCCAFMAGARRIATFANLRGTVLGGGGVGFIHVGLYWGMDSFMWGYIRGQIHSCGVSTSSKVVGASIFSRREQEA